MERLGALKRPLMPPFPRAVNVQKGMFKNLLETGLVLGRFKRSHKFLNTKQDNLLSEKLKETAKSWSITLPCLIRLGLV